jgi:hypothetical protein
MVAEAHTRLGPDATPERVLQELRAGGVETTIEEVRKAWPGAGPPAG